MEKELGSSPVELVILRGFQEFASVPVTINAIAASETSVLLLAIPGTRYLVRHLRLKCADPGANTVTVKLYELVNGALIVVDTFAITLAGSGLPGDANNYFSLMDMFGIPYLVGDSPKVTVQSLPLGGFAVTGQYSYARNEG